MVNWDPSALTALSDEEVIYKESQGKLYYLRYKVEGTDKYIVVATTRPETILGDTALCVNPNDERYKWLSDDARVIVPLVGRSIPVIRDEYVDLEFGTECFPVSDMASEFLELDHSTPHLDWIHWKLYVRKRKKIPLPTG